MDSSSNLAGGGLAQKVIEAQVGNLYFADDNNRLHAASTSVGSGKTRAAIGYMLCAERAARNFIYVAPTVRLVEQTKANLERELGAAGLSARNLELIHSQRNTTEEGASATALSHINNAIPDVGAVVIVTTTTFLSILPRIKSKKSWHVILDEAFSPLEFVEYKLGAEDREKGREYFESLFCVDPQDNKAVTPASGKSNLVQSVASGDWNHAGTKYQGMQKLAKSVLNDALRVELACEHRDKYVFAVWVTPDYFKEFAETIFLAALFEQTILCHLWHSLYSVDFKAHDYFSAAIERNIHESQGSLVAVGHLLHEEDFASKYNLQRNHATGQVYETEPGQRVIDKMIEIASVFFTGKQFLLQLNNWTGYRTGLVHAVPGNARLIPTMSHGLNDYQGCQYVAAFAVTNPEPHQKEWLISRTGLTEPEVFMAYRIHTVYQACGRSAVRDWSNTKPVTFLTTGKDDARFLHKLFVGSQWLGQIGGLPRYGRDRRSLSDNPRYHALRAEYKRLKAKQGRGTATSADLEGLDGISMEMDELKRDSGTNRTLLG